MRSTIIHHHFSKFKQYHSTPSPPPKKKKKTEYSDNRSKFHRKCERFQFNSNKNGWKNEGKFGNYEIKNHVEINPLASLTLARYLVIQL